MRKPQKMTLYVFEPYDWDYCGGAIGVVARTFDEAVETIVEAERIRSAPEAKEWGLQAGSCMRYKPEYFQRDKKVFERDESDQWLLTNEIYLSEKYIAPKVLFDNWNFG